MHIRQRMNDFVIDLLKTNIPATYFYHNYEHTLYVQEKAREIGMHENCTDAELALLNTAALWHDIGYINTYQDHEQEGCKIAQQYLPEFGYTFDEIDKISGMIMATKIPQSPKNKLEEIIADADLVYLGSDRATDQAQQLYRELNALNPLITMEVWNKIEIDFIMAHHYYTRYCKKNKEQNKQAYLKSLLNKA
jgi:uncharacterized protein